MTVTTRTTSLLEQRLFSALENQDESEVTSLLLDEHDEAGAIRPHCMNDSGYTLLGIAAQKGFTANAKHLIEFGCLVNQSDFYGQIPVQYASENGFNDMLSLMIANGVDLNWMDTKKDGLSAIHLATLNGHSDIVKHLIEAGCDLNVKDINGVSVLHCAVANDQEEIVHLLLSAEAEVNSPGTQTNRTPLFVAAEVGNTKIVDMLLKKGARVNTLDQYGMSPLCAVCIQDNTEMAQCLLKAGSRVNRPDNNGSIPLHYAARFGNLTLIQTLLSKGSDVNKLNMNFESPLQIAVKKGHTETVKVLVEHGADVNVRNLGDSSMLRPIHVATTSPLGLSEFTSMLLTLISGGCDLNSCDSLSMETPLFHAITREKTNFAILLLQHGADPNMGCPRDVTFLQKCCEKRAWELVDTVLHCKIDWSRETWLDKDIHMSGINPRLLTGYAKHIPAVLLKHVDWYFRLLEARANPQPLVDLSRQILRAILCRDLHTKVQALPLPPRLKDLVMMKFF